ncbi:MAG: DNA alkylation repair protein [Thermodesulfovibrionales bacterium]
MLNKILNELTTLADPEKAKLLARFFKTGKGEYGEGDQFLGIMVPQQRSVAKKYQEASLPVLKRLLASRVHEHRLVSLLILLQKYRKADAAGRKTYADFYLQNIRRINNWDLVDLSAPRILGDHLLDKDTSLLFRLAASGNVWERRIAVMSTFAFINQRRFEDSLKLAAMLLDDRHDLIHKAVGWMLREIGKRDQAAEETFLKEHCREMPRTMLRYAIERFDEKKRKFYMKK